LPRIASDDGPGATARIKIVRALDGGHFFAYPVAVVWAMASIPLAIHLLSTRLTCSPTSRPWGSSWSAAWLARRSAFLVVHLGPRSGPFAADPALGFKRFLRRLPDRAIGVLLGIGSWGG